MIFITDPKITASYVWLTIDMTLSFIFSVCVVLDSSYCHTLKFISLFLEAKIETYRYSAGS
jgi:hypothetical protein